MDWNKIKTIFILTFLILDIYLTYEFIKLIDSQQYELKTETSFEKKLNEYEIDYVDLPKGELKDRYLTAKPKTVSKRELNLLKETILSGQELNNVEGPTLHAVFKEPIKLKVPFDSKQLDSYISSHILYGDQYHFWEKSDGGNTITYFQEYDGKMFYKNINAELTFYLNRENEIVSYKQTYLEDIQGRTESEKIIQPIKAIETLWNNGLLKPKSKITEIELGYYTLVHLTTSQVLTPVWRFEINNEENLFVNAFEGQIIQLNNEEKKIVE